MNFPFPRTKTIGLFAGGMLALLTVVVVFVAGAPAQSGPGPGGPKPPRDGREGKAAGNMPGNEGRIPGPPRGYRPDGGSDERGDPFSNLSEEEQKRVREVLAKVWQDPALMAAKESVRVSTEEYREALKEAVIRMDPEVAGLMNKVHEGSKSADLRKRYEEHMGGWRPGSPGGKGPGGPGSPGNRPGGSESWSDLPEFFRALDDEKRVIYLEARDQAQASEKIVELRKEVEGLEKKERASREERFALMMRMRRAMRQEMIRIDPRIEEIVPDFPRDTKSGGGPNREGGAKGGQKTDQKSGPEGPRDGSGTKPTG